MSAPSEYAIPLPGGRIVTFAGNFPLTNEEWDHAMSVLAVMRAGLVRDPSIAETLMRPHAAAGKDGGR